jgi:hypothetical protein
MAELRVFRLGTRMPAVSYIVHTNNDYHLCVRCAAFETISDVVFSSVCQIEVIWDQN